MFVSLSLSLSCSSCIHVNAMKSVRACWIRVRRVCAALRVRMNVYEMCCGVSMPRRGSMRVLYASKRTSHRERETNKRERSFRATSSGCYVHTVLGRCCRSRLSEYSRIRGTRARMFNSQSRSLENVCSSCTRASWKIMFWISISCLRRLRSTCVVIAMRAMRVVRLRSRLRSVVFICMCSSIINHTCVSYVNVSMRVVCGCREWDVRSI